MSYVPDPNRMAGICSSKDLRIPGIGRETHKPGAGPLAEFEINAENLAARRAFIRLTAREAKIMSELIPWSRSVAPQLAKELYDWQFAFSCNTQVLQRFFAKRRGIGRALLREKLEHTQAA